jgi:pimeloyl-ACP methyl ester carboxylesterase
MRIIERGHGELLIFVPGIQGRWEYQRAAIDALAASFRVITFSLSDEPSARTEHDAEHVLDSFVAQISRALDYAGATRAVICGVSFGGVVALRFAARYPERTTALVLVSTPGPGWRLRPRHEVYAGRPLLYGPLFLMETPFRVRREVAIAIPSRTGRWRFSLDQLRTLFQAPLSLTRLAARARLLGTGQRAQECAAITAPTMIVHGEPRLDHVVDVEGTTEYGRLIHGARITMLEGTGHLGSITRPELFAEAVRRFVATARGEQSNHAA